MLYKDVVFFEFSYFYPQHQTLFINNIIRTGIFNNFWNNTGVLFSLEEGCFFFFYLETERLLPIIREKFRKLSEIDGFHYRREFKQFCPLLRRCREPKEMSALDKCFWGYGYAWNWLSHYDDDATISHNNENCNSLWTAIHLRVYREKSRASGNRKETREQGAGKKVRALYFLRPSRLQRSLARSLATRNGEVATIP